MSSFRGGKLSELPLSGGSLWLLSDIAECKGRERLYTRQAPQLLKSLREAALIQSAESSNRIEGVTVAPDRLIPLVAKGVKPRDRSEEEVQAYRKALDLIHSQAQKLRITPDLIRRLHGIIQDGAGDAGQYKRIDNQIIETRAGAEPIVRFETVRASETPAAVETLCIGYRHVVDQQLAHPLMAVAALILDFLCIHPFRDGNGRVSRLLTLLAVYQHGFEVGRYISIERLIEQSREDYYAVLKTSSQGWHEGKHELVPWLNYCLDILRRAYREFEQRAGEVGMKRGAKTALVEAAIEAMIEPFTLAELERACPTVSRDSVRRTLRQLRDAGKIECLPRGRSSAWQKRG